MVNIYCPKCNPKSKAVLPMLRQFKMRGSKILISDTSQFEFSDITTIKNHIGTNVVYCPHCKTQYYIVVKLGEIPNDNFLVDKRKIR